MRNALLMVLVLLTLSIVSKGQDLSKYISWKFELEKTKNANEFLIKATATLEPNWHIFDLDPGGDGLLIAPEFSFSNDKVKLINTKSQGKVITATIAGVEDPVRYHEKKVSFLALVRSNAKELKGSIYYQICDHEKCWAPTEEAFSFQIK